MAAAYAFDDLEPSDLVQFNKGNGRLSKHLWGDLNVHHYQSATPFALKGIDFSSEVRLRPAATMVLARDISRAPARELALIDSHHSNCTVNGINLWNRQWTDRVINPIRDPREVCCSLSAHLGTSYEDTAAFMADSEARFPPEDNLDDETEDEEAEDDDTSKEVPLRHILLSWSAHVHSWFESDDLPVLSVRYEDMKQDPVQAFHGIFEFLGISDLEEERIEDAVETVRFDRMREAEEDHGFPLASEEQDYFFRSGQADGWKEELPTEVARKIEEDHGEMMEALGYL